MNFEEMKVIWDRQNEEPLYAFDREALHAGVRRGARSFGRLVVSFEAVMIGSTTLLILSYMVNVVKSGFAADRLLPAGILAAAALHFWTGIRRRRRLESEFDSSLLGDLTRALWQVNHHIERSRALRWGYIAPLVLAVTIDFFLPWNASKPFGWFALFLIVMIIPTWAIEWEIRCLYLPKKRRLETLRDKLAASDP